MKRAAALSLVLAVMLSLVLTVGCSRRSLVGEWYDGETGMTVKIDKEWLVEQDGDQARYEVTGESAVRLTTEGRSFDVRYELSGDRLTFTGSGTKRALTRMGSSEQIAAKKAWEQRQKEIKAGQEEYSRSLKAESERKECEYSRNGTDEWFEEYAELLAKGQFAGGKYYTPYEGKVGDILYAGGTTPEIAKKVQGDFSSVKTLQDAVGVLRSAYTAASLRTSYTNATSWEWKCPSGGDITAQGWRKRSARSDKPVLIFECSVHGKSSAETE